MVTLTLNPVQARERSAIAAQASSAGSQLLSPKAVIAAASSSSDPTRGVLLLDPSIMQILTEADGCRQ